MAEKSSKEIVERAQKLVALAQDDDTEEGRNAAMQVVRLMTQHDLVLIPKDEAERAMRVIEGAKDLAARVQKERMNGMILGGLLGFTMGGGKLGR